MLGFLDSRTPSSKASACRRSDGVRTRTRCGGGCGLNRLGLSVSLALASLLMLVFAGSAAAAPARVELGNAERFAVLGGDTVTNTGPTVVNGDLGVSPGLACTGFQAPCIGDGPGTVNAPGTIHAGDEVADDAQASLTAAYIDAAGRPCDSNLTGQDLGGMTLVSGVYCFPSTSAGLTNTLTLNGQGNRNAVFIFQIGSTLTTASDSRVNLINGAQACNVYWQVGSSATLGVRTAFTGNILSLASIGANTDATVDGRLLARTAGAVTLQSNTVTRARCTTPPGTGTPPGTTPGTGTGPGSSGGPDRSGPQVRIFQLPGLRQPPARRRGARRPPARTVCTSRNFTASVRLRDRSGIRRVDVYLDGRRVRRTARTRFSLRIRVRGLRVGRHRITVIARDRAGNRSVTRRRFGRCALRLAAPRFTG